MRIIIQRVSDFSLPVQYYQAYFCTFEADVLNQIQNHLISFEDLFKKSFKKMEKRLDFQIGSKFALVSIVNRVVRFHVI